jgi:hypothetical protein
MLPIIDAGVRKDPKKLLPFQIARRAARKHANLKKL